MLDHVGFIQTWGKKFEFIHSSVSLIDGRGFIYFNKLKLAESGVHNEQPLADNFRLLLFVKMKLQPCSVC